MLRGFNSFSNHGKSQTSCQGNDHLGDCCIFSISQDVFYKNLTNFQLVQGKTFQVIAWRALGLEGTLRVRTAPVASYLQSCIFPRESMFGMLSAGARVFIVLDILQSRS